MLPIVSSVLKLAVPTWSCTLRIGFLALLLTAWLGPPMTVAMGQDAAPAAAAPAAQPVAAPAAPAAAPAATPVKNQSLLEWTYEA
ncbi:MAG: hypothetical protein ACK44Z_03275, partial [Pirellulaceae bacterium]